MLKIAQLSSSESTPSIPAFFSAAAASSSTPPRMGVLSFRIFKPNKVAFNNMILSAIGTCCIPGFHSVRRKGSRSASSRKRFIKRNDQSFSTALQSSSLFVHPPPLPSLVVSSNLSPSDTPQRSDEWFALRKDKLTTSTFSTALGFWKGTRRYELWHEKVYDSESQILDSSKRFAMDWGVLNEGNAIDRYKNITGREVNSMGFAIHSKEQLRWLGASPDGVLDCLGILEVKCPYNKGKPERASPWSTMPFYYMPQVQGQMEIMDREWVDLYCWTPNGSSMFRVTRDRGYWDLIHGILREFWWENVVPAREALLLGEKEEAKSFMPTSTHRQTGLAIGKSIRLAAEAKLVCKEIAGQVEFFR
ncbi:PREDICTED: uncharacterized protein LOC104807694 isoform X2 [Tarenaya hassleriana]|uniref:uncharacterized protein LOC104807694 isoform X2 n=1 Tax=Tarenaya hassleriana TaxID=28532 RepID=UPI00053C8EEB|nr:PREDICTED: uncharacterized protein LOC104807694 isoform X2 [Tarenaya hassleriana]